MFRFNRFYLLLALVFSYSVPFVKINLPKVSENKSKVIFEEVVTSQITQKTNAATDFDWVKFFLIIYVSVSILLIMRALFSIIKIMRLQGKEINYLGQKVKILNQDLPAFSFWNTIYLGRKYVDNQQIDSRVFFHEKAHLRQKHSLDLIFVEIIKVVSWFNPAIYLYKKAVTNNHEFLADEVIVQKRFSIKDYQSLILKEIEKSENLAFANQFNFNNTKKRFIMMTTKKSKFEKFKKIIAVSAIAGTSICFVQKVYGFDNQTKAILTTNYSAKNTSKILDTIPKKIAVENQTRKNVPTTVVSKKFKENELPIPPPPPPAINFVNAEFPEGLNALRTSFSQNFDASSLNGKGTLKTQLSITIDENGKTTDVRADGPDSNFNNEAVRSMKVATQDKLWKSATEDGKPTSAVFQFPITMSFQ